LGRIWKSSFVDIGVETGAYAAGDALGSSNSFPGVPEHGYLVGVVVQDRDQEHPIFDVVIFDNDDIGGTTDNAAFAPTDTELSDAMGAVRVSDYFDFNANSIGLESDFRMPYWARHGVLYFQCVIRAAHTFTAVTDVQIAVYVEVA
jgi:hypothetical protein